MAVTMKCCAALLTFVALAVVQSQPFKCTRRLQLCAQVKAFLAFIRQIPWNYSQANIKTAIAARPRNVRQIISQRVKSLMKYIAREGKWGVWQRQGLSLRRMGTERPPQPLQPSVKVAASRPHLSHKETCAEAAVIYTAWPHSPCPTFFDLWLERYSNTNGWNSAESFCWTHTKVQSFLDVSVLVGIEAERGGREKDTGRWRRRRRRGEGVYRRQAAVLAVESLPRRSFFFIGQSKHRTGNLCLPLQRAPGSWCHNAKWDGANRSAMIKNKRGGCFALFF